MSVSIRSGRGVLRRGLSTVGARMPAVVDAYRFVRNPRWALDLRRDVSHTRRRASFLRAAPSPADGAPLALVALYRDDVLDTKLGLVLTSGLRLRGAAAAVVVPAGTYRRRVRRYGRAFGVRRVIAQDALRLSRDEVDECSEAARALLAEASDFTAVKTWRFRGYRIGDHVLSTVIRATFDGAPDLADPTVRALVVRILDEVLVNYVRAERLLDDLRPRVVLVEEANYSTNGPFVDAAVRRDVDVIQTIPTWRDDALISKRLTSRNRRTDARTVAPDTLARLDAEMPSTTDWDVELDEDFARRYGGAWALGRVDHPPTEDLRSDEMIREIGLDPQRPTAVIFSHVLWDGSLFYGEDLFDNYADWLAASIRAAGANDQVNWVIKAHPSNVFRSAHGDVSGEAAEVVLTRTVLPRLPEHVHVLLPDTRISTRSLYQFADYGVTVRGTPGLEMACFGKPVLTAGTGAYSGLGFTDDSTSTDEYLAKLGRLETYEPLHPDVQRAARWYAYAYFVRHPWLARSFEFTFDFPERGWHPLDRNVTITAASANELRRRGDLDEWAQWVLDSRDEDFVAVLHATAKQTRTPR